MKPLEFVYELFGEREGYIYAPTKSDKWRRHFFEWPAEKERLEQHLNTWENREVYIAPALFSEPTISKQTFLGTRYLWADFDKGVPNPPTGLHPSIRVMSSTPEREHWYWRLKDWETDPNKVEDYARRLTYHFEADLSGWDFQTVLRPPGTYNHKRNKPVRVVYRDGNFFNLSEFDRIPQPPVADQEVDIGESLPDLLFVTAKYNWTPDAYELLTKVVPEGQRSAALTRLGFECAEMGMLDNEIYVVLDSAATRWKKFEGRSDKEKRLKDVIRYVKSKKAAQEPEQNVSRIYGFQEFMNLDIKFEWLIENVVPVAGSGVFFGPAGVGKTTLALRMAIALATGEKKFLNWTINRQAKVLFISLEMWVDELQHFLAGMKLQNPDVLQENFHIFPVGEGIQLESTDTQSRLLRVIDTNSYDYVIIDSLGMATQNLMEGTVRIFGFLNRELRKKRRCGYLFIHHPRKLPPGDFQPTGNQYDMYGDGYIANNAQFVVNLGTTSIKNRIKVHMAKSRLASAESDFYIKRTSDNNFEVTKATEKKQSNSSSLGLFGEVG